MPKPANKLIKHEKLIAFPSPVKAPGIIWRESKYQICNVFTEEKDPQKLYINSPINCAARTGPSTPAGMPSGLLFVPLYNDDHKVRERHVIERATVNIANTNGTDILRMDYFDLR